ncbi:hypothetical protein Sbal195_1596 [Shewanella baltica OS195]|uniref:Uncharacterized protein n=1 Tax=Shewanella baltica (strain OS195) TaxID=399599 RepID=A9KWE6_SHEB9|nr:hypothetical protein Sbal195_1596 [Shewanella baltica OS195]
MRTKSSLSILTLSCLTALGTVSLLAEAAIPNTIPKLSMVEPGRDHTLLTVGNFFLSA